jgi:hypothetical protein
MKTAEFWGSMKCFPYEKVDEYYNQFHDLLDDLSDANTVITTGKVIFPHSGLLKIGLRSKFFFFGITSIL